MLCEITFGSHAVQSLRQSLAWLEIPRFLRKEVSRKSDCLEVCIFFVTDCRDASNTEYTQQHLLRRSEREPEPVNLKVLSDHLGLSVPTISGFSGRSGRAFDSQKDA
jgi:hypothetical protein